MTTQPEALWLADVINNDPTSKTHHDEAASELRRLHAEVEALRADAERYRWLSLHCRSTPEHWGGRWSIVIEGPCPTRHNCEDAFDNAIDAARERT